MGFTQFYEGACQITSHEVINTPKAVVRGNKNGFFMLFKALIAAINCLKSMNLRDQIPVLQLGCLKNRTNLHLGLELIIEEKDALILATTMLF
jgi:hypothetical protein